MFSGELLLLHPVLVFYRVLTRLLLILPLIAVGLGLEALKRKTAPSSVALNLRVTVLYTISDAILGTLVFVWAMSLITKLPGAGLVPKLPSWLIVLIWSPASDFLYYWVHRAQHAIPWFWALHEIHHADEHVNASTAQRQHWLEPVTYALLIGAPLAYVLTPSSTAMWVIGFWAALVQMIAHLDLPISLGRWSWLFVTPLSHRLHHALAREYHDKNFASQWPIWDVLFGTYVQPPRETMTTGLGSGASFTSVREVSVHPFQRWWAILHGR